MTSAAVSKSDLVVLGTLGAVYGIKGWLRVNAYTNEVSGIFDYAPWFIGREGKWQQTEVIQWRWHNKGLVAKLANVDDRDAAALLTGMEIAVLASELPALEENEFYWRDVEGLSVVNTEGYDMGKVDHMLSTVANDVLVVTANSNDAFGKRERLIPFIQSQYIVAVNKELGTITVDWPADF